MPEQQPFMDTYPPQSYGAQLHDDVRPRHPGRLPTVIGATLAAAVCVGAIQHLADENTGLDMRPDFGDTQVQAQAKLIRLDPTTVLQIGVGKYATAVDAENIKYHLTLKTPDPLGGIGLDTPDPTYTCDLNRRITTLVTARYSVPASALQATLGPSGATNITIDGSKLGVTTGLEADANTKATDFVITDGKKDFSKADNTCMAWYKLNASFMSMLGKVTPDWAQLTPEDMLQQMLQDTDNYTNTKITNTAFHQTEKCSEKPEVRAAVGKYAATSVTQFFTILASKQPNTKLGTVTFKDGTLAITKDKTAEQPVPPLKEDGNYVMKVEDNPAAFAISDADSTCKLEAAR